MDGEARITIPDVVERFEAYYKRPGLGEWGSLHIVLADGNVADDDVKFCLDWAVDHRDSEGAALAEILLRMSKTQRRKLPNVIEERERRKDDRASRH